MIDLPELHGARDLHRVLDAIRRDVSRSLADLRANYRRLSRGVCG